MADVRDVAKFILSLADTDADECISNMKLQKLLYYCQGFCLVMLGRKLFPDPILRWDHGPVVRTIWEDYNRYGAGAIDYPTGFDASQIGPDEKHVINEIYSLYGQYSAWGLRNMTHDEPPWQNTLPNGEITEDKMIDFFRTQLN
jgi:uncharacterized phage-associated protein